MNILFIGPYRQNDGWGLSARDYLKSLSSLNHTIAATPIYMSNNVTNVIDPDLLNLENVKCDYYDVIIQNVLPNYFEKFSSYTIGIYPSETKSLNNSIFIDNINLLDELWVTSSSEKKELEKAGVNIVINVIPGPTDIDAIKVNENVNKLDIPETHTNFVFYMIAEYNERENIPAAVIAYNREFSNDYDTSFIIKTNVPGQNDEEANKTVMQNMRDLKQKLRLYNNLNLYKQEIIITHQLNPQQIASIHQTGDCLLVTSSGEACCEPAINALYFGNQILCTKGIHTESILGNAATYVESTEVPIVMDNPPAFHIHTGWETWNEISILDLQKKMRQAYDRGKIKNPDSKNLVIDNLSYDSIADQMEHTLCQL